MIEGALPVISACFPVTDGSYRRNVSPTFTPTTPKRRLITTSVLLFLVSTFIPYQFAYIVACIVQIATCTRALRLARETVSASTLTANPFALMLMFEQRSGGHYNFYNYSHSILVLMIWILPINIPVLVVWIHNLAVHWLTPFSSHHNVLSIMPFILLVETMTSGRMIPRVTTRLAPIFILCLKQLWFDLLTFDLLTIQAPLHN